MKKPIACGAFKSYVIDENANIWYFGADVNGIQQLPAETGTSRMIAVAAGCYHALFLDDAGKVWGLGYNNSFQLGIADSPAAIITLRLIPLPETEIVAIACGDYHSLLLDAEGFVWASGDNLNGQCGNFNVRSKQPSFRKIDDLQNIRDIQASVQFSMFLSDDGEVWTCGNFPKNSASSELRLVSVPPIRAMAAGVYFCLLIDFEGKVWGYGDNDFGQLGCPTFAVGTPTMFRELPPIRACAAGWNFCIFLGEDNSFWTTGCNTHGTLCDGKTASPGCDRPIRIETEPPIVTVSCGWNHSLFVDCDGDVWCSGEGKKLPFGKTECTSVLTRVAFQQKIPVERRKHVKSARKI